jgi:hypothetical protein
LGQKVKKNCQKVVFLKLQKVAKSCQKVDKKVSKKCQKVVQKVVTKVVKSCQKVSLVILCVTGSHLKEKFNKQWWVGG